MNNEVPAISIIVPAYRTEDVIGETLASIFRQTLTDFEVIVVSNEGYAAEEEMTRALGPWTGRITRVRQKVPGLANARNAGLEYCRAPLVAFLDSDDIWEPDYLSVQVGFLNTHPGVDVVYCNAVFFGFAPMAGRTFMQSFPSNGPVTFLNLLTKRTCVFVSVTARLDIIKRVGMFDGSLAGAEDLDLWLRIARAGGNIAWHDKVLVRYRVRPGSLSNDPEIMCDHLLALFRKVESSELSPEERQCLAGLIARSNAERTFWRGKRALYRAEFSEARRLIRESNRFFQRRKWYLVSFLLRVTPRPLLFWVHRRYPSEHAFMHS